MEWFFLHGHLGDDYSDLMVKWKAAMDARVVLFEGLMGEAPEKQPKDSLAM